ncbi:uncharacterized protein CANTADRAFT_50174 [Suhomyces tanzawaensis NRRL Y-17324]|uniref:Uncharacterized protein n=1 Tax=Suhomyces tanzawaensis NRRL Y-17324 TaxID=984487 RepID=A0A1E4SJJ3_9ASCO|nr:uncharacterized protein CANTADRAFT_50174 [Suhomyces tanzawaensis NRRL Y-17324]ODV79669.1 hypothetical protein CANTADRAFT_50174 [Suhomyces tanzawaensis NRRL Y-17324]
MSQAQEQLEAIPGYDIAMDYFNDYAGEHFNGRDPYEDKEGNKVRLPSTATKEEQKAWKKIQRRAWMHDKCFLGSCGVGLDCGLGLAPIVVLVPVMGPLLMYAVHTRLLSIAQERMMFPNKVVAKIHSLILLDLVLTLPPLIGSFFGWMNGCSTKTAATIFEYMIYVAKRRAENKEPTYLGTGPIRDEPLGTNPPIIPSQRQHQYSKPGKKARKGHNQIEVGQQQSGFV